jgi:aminobenzoyl-glutamate transport protein
MPPAEPREESPRRARALARALDRVERIGNALPHPASLFVGLTLFVVLLSSLLHATGVGVAHPLTAELVRPADLLSVDGLRRMVVGLLPNFIDFAPLGSVLVCLLGLSVAEHSGLLGAVVRLIIGATPRRWLTGVVVLCGMLSHSVGDVGYVLLLPLAAALYHTVGRNPIAGLAAAFAGVSGGFAANVLLSPTDVILAGLTTEAARLLDPTYEVAPTASYYFLAASVLLVTIVATTVSLRIVEPRLGLYVGEVVPEPPVPLSAVERRALGWAGLSLLVLVGLILWGLLPADGALQDPARPGFVGSYFVRGLVTFIFLLGVVPGLAYGVAAGTIRRDVDVYKGMAKNMELVAGYLVVVFFIAQFINVFNWSNLGVLAAVQGAGVIRALDLGVVPLVVMIVLLTASIDLVMGSSSAKWAMLGPILVPLFMLLGYTPELTVTSYRVGDSITNIITPLSSNFPLVLMFLQRYSPKAGIGTLTATMLPYSLANLVCWTLLLVSWVLLGLPTGPGAPLLLAK